MRIGLISDIHGNAPALQAVFKVLLPRVNLILFMGDLAGYYPFVNDCVQMWDPEKIISIRGNHDQVLMDCLQLGTKPSPDYLAHYGSALERSWRSLSPVSQELLGSWPEQRHLRIDSVAIAIFHGAPWDPLEGRVYPDFQQWQNFRMVEAELILLGHTHYQMVRRWQDRLIINPGSVGQPRDRSGVACFAEIELPSGEVRLGQAAYDASAIVEDAFLHDPQLPYLVEVLRR